MSGKTQEKRLFEFLEEWNSGRGIRVHTSGSTGKPKEIILPMEQLERSARRTNRFFGINRNTLIHCAISFEFIGGKMMIARSMVSGCGLSFGEPSLYPELPPGQKRIRLMAVVPPQMDQILTHRNTFARVEAFLVGGSAIDNALWTRMTTSGMNIWESYGMTETASHIALRRVAGAADRRPRFIPMPGVALHTEEDGTLVINDGDYEIRTNDLAEIFPDRSFVIKGRKDDVIVTGGIKVIPQKLEAILHPYISELCEGYYITSEPDERWTSRLVLVFVSKEGDEKRKEESKILIEKAVSSVPEDILPRKLRPKKTIPVDRLPLTASGKLKRIHPGKL